jgi:hypothetical protein
MKTSMKSVLVRRFGALAVAALALSFAFGGPARAEEPETLPSTLREMVFVPIMRAVQGLEQRLTRIEATIASYAESVSTQRIAARQLCVSDDSGAQTCITKAQLDALLMAQVPTQAHVETVQPSIIVSETPAAPQAEASETETAAASPEAETGEIATTPATIELAESAGSQELAQDDQELTQTGSIPSPSQGAALVWVPEVEITKPTSTPSEE